MYVMTDVGLRRNWIFMRGVPDNVIVLEEYAPNSGFAAALSAFTTFLTTGNNFVVRSRTPNAFTPFPIVGLTPQSSGFRILCPVQSPTIPNGAKIQITGVQIPGYNGIKTVVNQTTTGAGAGQEFYDVGGASPISIPPGGAYRGVRLDWSSNVVSNCYVAGVSRRKTGRPFGTPAGRRQTTFARRPLIPVGP
jgi:hypothetical protein